MTVSREELESMIDDAFADYDDDVRAEWKRIRLEPALWHRRSCGAEGEHSWAIAVRDRMVLWYDEAEDCFSWSELTSHGIIDDDYSDYLDFASIPRTIALRSSNDARARLREGNVPAELAGAGTLVRTQPYYWDVRTSSVGYRVHFRDVDETIVAERTYAAMEIATDHPLLTRYREPYRALYFIGSGNDPAGTSREIEAVLRTLSSGWRGLCDYSSSVEAVERRLRGGHGMLLSVPTSVSHAAEVVLARQGVDTSALGRDVVTDQPERRVLVLGRSAVVAGGFAFERLR